MTITRKNNFLKSKRLSCRRKKNRSKKNRKRQYSRRRGGAFFSFKEKRKHGSDEDSIYPFLLTENPFDKFVDIPQDVIDFIRSNLKTNLDKETFEYFKNNQDYFITEANRLRNKAFETQVDETKIKKSNNLPVLSAFEDMQNKLKTIGLLNRFSTPSVPASVSSNMASAAAALNKEEVIDLTEIADNSAILPRDAITMQDVPLFYLNYKMKIPSLSEEKKRDVALDLMKVARQKLQLQRSDEKYLETLRDSTKNEAQSYSNKRTILDENNNKKSESIDESLQIQLGDNEYRIITARGDGNCYLYSFLMGVGAIPLPNPNVSNRELQERLIKSLLYAQLIRNEIVKHINNENIEIIEGDEEFFNKPSLQAKKNYIMTSSFFMEGETIRIMQDLFDYQSIIFSRTAGKVDVPYNHVVNAKRHEGAPLEKAKIFIKDGRGENAVYGILFEDNYLIENVNAKTLKIWNPPEFQVNCHMPYNSKNPDKYIIFLRSGAHYDLIVYNNRKSFTFESLPYSMKQFIKRNCANKGGGTFGNIPVFREYFSRG